MLEIRRGIGEGGDGERRACTAEILEHFEPPDLLAYGRSRFRRGLDEGLVKGYRYAWLIAVGPASGGRLPCAGFRVRGRLRSVPVRRLMPAIVLHNSNKLALRLVPCDVPCPSRRGTT